MSAKIVPVILSGGAGVRLWPLSRESFPKQFHPLSGSRTLLQETALRVADRGRFERLVVVANGEHRFVVAEQLRSVADAPTIILEPTARNTAAAVATAAYFAHLADPDALILIMPADHAVPDTEAFLTALDAGMDAAQDGSLVLFGISPTGPATDYGYIRANGMVRGAARQVEAFVEKPEASVAATYVEDPDCYWNSGIFLLPAAIVLEEFERYAPSICAAARTSVDAGRRDADFLRLDENAFAASPTTSFDVAVLEHTRRAVVVPATFDWADIGSWGAMWDVADHDNFDNVELGDVVSEETSRSYLRSEGPMIATVGVDDLVVVATPDVVLVARRGSEQGVKRVVERLRRSNHRAATQARRVYRPWGSYESIYEGERCQVKCLTVRPGGCLSLQSHFHRSEHWVVVNGTAEVQVNGACSLVTENGYVYVPLGIQHRLKNPGKVPLNLIEVQSGAYLGEDDIIRLEDDYARV